MSTDAVQKAASREAGRQHLIVEARYSQTVKAGKPIAETPILCSCSEWVTSGTWEQHRGQTVRAARHLPRAERRALGRTLKPYRQEA